MINQFVDTVLFVEIALAIAGLIVITIVLVKLRSLGKARPKPGLKVKALVLAVEPDQSREVKGTIALKLVLEIQLQGCTTYTIRTKRKVPASQVESLFQPGQVLDIMIKSENGEEVAILGFDAVPNAYAGARFNLF